MKIRKNLFTSHSFAAFTALMAITVASPAAEETNGKKLPTISVAKTESKGIGHWQPAMGDGLAQMMITELNKLDNMKVLESVALEDLREERRLGEAGEVDAREAVKKGQWKGADYTFKTVVTRFGSKQSNYGGSGIPIPTPFGIGGGGFNVRNSENEVRIDWRIIDNASREIVKGASDSAVGVEKGSGFNFGSWGGGGFSDNHEFMDSALGKATVKAINQIIEKVKTLELAPGTRAASQEADARAETLAMRSVRGSVELVDGKEIWISLGSKNGFVKGDKIKLYKPIEKKNQQGKVVTTTYKEVGEIVLRKVQKEKSMGELDSAAVIGEGWAAADSAIDIDTIDESGK
jgi:curli biogenesis system outer membrane secretion channel CsgG